MPPDERQAVVVWRPPNERPEVIEQRATEDRLRQARAAEAAARLALAKARETQASIMQVGADLVLSQLRKYMKLAESADFDNAVGPLDPNIILKLAEFVMKNHRLDTGQATEHVAHTIGPSIDFSKFTQEERDRWRELAHKGGGSEDV